MKPICGLSVLFGVVSFALPAMGEEKLMPAEGRVTWRLAYWAREGDDDMRKPVKQKEEKVTVLLGDGGNGPALATEPVSVPFADMNCQIYWGNGFAKIFVYTAKGRLLYERMFQAKPRNLIGDGFTGQNTVYHPSSGAFLEFSAFYGPEPRVVEDDVAAKVEGASYTVHFFYREPTYILADGFGEEEGISSIQRNIVIEVPLADPAMPVTKIVNLPVEKAEFLVEIQTSKEQLVLAVSDAKTKRPIFKNVLPLDGPARDHYVIWDGVSGLSNVKHPESESELQLWIK